MCNQHLPKTILYIYNNIIYFVNNNNIFGRNGTYVQNIYIKFIFTALSYQAIKLLQNNLIQNHTVIKFKLLTKYIYSGIFISI